MIAHIDYHRPRHACRYLIVGPHGFTTCGSWAVGGLPFCYEHSPHLTASEARRIDAAWVEANRLPAVSTPEPEGGT